MYSRSLLLVGVLSTLRKRIISNALGDNDEDADTTTTSSF